MSINIKKRTTAEMEADVERYSQMGKQLAALCDGKNSEDVFYSSLLFFSNNYAMNLGEKCRQRVIDMVLAQLLRDTQDAAQDQVRSHFKECQDCRSSKPCQFYFKLLERVAHAANAHTLRVNPDGSFELSDQGCPHETGGGKDPNSTQ